jgi:hypothetical protein
MTTRFQTHHSDEVANNQNTAAVSAAQAGDDGAATQELWEFLNVEHLTREELRWLLARSDHDGRG